MSTTHLKLDIIKEDNFLIEESETDIFITGTCFSMPVFADRTWSSKNLHIQAYDLTLTNNMYALEKNITIATRYLRLDKDITISVSGKEGAKYPVSANNGRGPGGHGQHGSKGRKGGDGGNITITYETIYGKILILKSIGGNGGIGQNGGSGQKGKPGSAAPDRSLDFFDSGAGRKGGTGYPGGNQGKGGQGGDAGNGGVILINSSETPDATIEIDVRAGNPGKPGKNGKKGLGGDGGAGGRGVKCFEHPYREPFF